MTYILINLETGCPYEDSEGKPLKFVGKQKLKEFLNENIQFQTEYLNMLIQHIQPNDTQYGSLLDQRQLSEMMAQERSCDKDTVDVSQ